MKLELSKGKAPFVNNEALPFPFYTSPHCHFPISPHHPISLRPEWLQHHSTENLYFPPVLSVLTLKIRARKQPLFPRPEDLGFSLLAFLLLDSIKF